MKKSTTKSIVLIIATALFSLPSLAQNTITTDSILQLSTCAGGNILIPYKATGSYPSGNIFTAQLSNALGQFTSPVNIGQVPFNTGVILGVIPKSANFGFLYKIRVVSSNPPVTGTPCPNTLVITQVAQLNQIVASPNDTICQGDSATLTAINIASTYKWSTGDTTRSITVKKGGVYSVTTKDVLTCQSDASITIVLKACDAGTHDKKNHGLFSVYPNPATTLIYLDKALNNQKTNYQIYTIVGQVLKAGTIDGPAIGITELKSGLYFIHISTNGADYTSRFIKE